MGIASGTGPHPAPATAREKEFYTQRSQTSLRRIRFGCPLDPWSSVPLRSLRSLGELPFLIGVLRAEIAKIIETDPVWCPLDPWSSVLLRSLHC
jgi:hypothetical protein